ncbi:hypothetical protein TELCIR_09549 [Teladorsagia circumcincta]|uniref:Uncharacterized protein n=1 Tax=Teladorsagia circumcincta TaxID=45464 RepID=A0A2G9UEI9_TELCI|nr:hypothetical protein TELCIR_09549 [Teladorsagia circumcincta]
MVRKHMLMELSLLTQRMKKMKSRSQMLKSQSRRSLKGKLSHLKVSLQHSRHHAAWKMKHRRQQQSVKRKLGIMTRRTIRRTSM